MRNVLGMRMVLDTSRFVEGAKIANRALASMEYVAGRTSKRMAQFGVELESLGYIAGAGLIGAAGAAFQSRALWEKVIGPAIEGATQFDKRLRQAYYLSGMTAGSALADGFKAEIEKAALFSSLNPEQLTQGLNELIKTGVESSDAKKMIQPLIDIVEGSFGEVDPERAGRMMGLLSLKFKRPDTVGITEWATKLGDMSFALAEMTHLNIGDIESMLGSMSSAVALSPSTKPAEFFALMKMLSDSSMKARRQGQNLDSFANMFLSMFSKLEAGSKKTVKGFEMLFGEANAGNILESMFMLDPKTGQYVQKSMGDTLGLVLDQLPRLINELGAEGRKTWIQAVDEMFGQDVGTRFALLAEGFTTKDVEGNILKGSAAIKEMTKQFDHMSGNAKKAADAYRSSWEGIGKAIQGAYETFMSMIGDEMLNILSGLIMSTKDITAQMVLFTQQRPLLRQVLAILLMVSFATGMIAAGFFSILSVATMFLIFMAPGMASLLTMFKTAKSAVMGWKDAFVQVRKSSRHALLQMKNQLESVNKELEEGLINLKGFDKKLSKLEISKNKNSIFNLDNQLSNFTFVGQVLSKLEIVGGILAFVFITATIAVFTFGVAVMGVYRLFTSPLFKGKGGFLDGLIKKFQIAKNVIAGLSELFTKGFISGSTFDKLNKEGGLAVMENILKIGYRLYMMFKGIAEGIDWSGFDAALKGLFDVLGSGGPMDTTFVSSGERWRQIGKNIGGIITLMIDFAGILITILALMIKLTNRVKGLVKSNASLIETVATLVVLFTGLVFAAFLAMFMLGGVFLFVGGAMLMLQGLAIGFILLSSLVGLALLAIPVTILFLIGSGLAFVVFGFIQLFKIVKEYLVKLMAVGLLMTAAMLIPFLGPVIILMVLIGWIIKSVWGGALDGISEKFSSIIAQMNTLKELAVGFASAIVPGVGLFMNQDRIKNTFSDQNTGPMVPYVDAAVRSENAAIGAWNQTINLTANITVPPDTQTDSLPASLADELGRLLKAESARNTTERGYKLEYD